MEDAKFTTGHHHSNFGVMPPHHLLILISRYSSQPSQGRTVLHQHLGWTRARRLSPRNLMITNLQCESTMQHHSFALRFCTDDSQTVLIQKSQLQYLPYVYTKLEFVWIDSRISQHSISTLPMSHHKYNEWLKKVEIGICAL